MRKRLPAPTWMSPIWNVETKRKKPFTAEYAENAEVIQDLILDLSYQIYLGVLGDLDGKRLSTFALLFPDDETSPPRQSLFPTAGLFHVDMRPQ